jgi:CHAT domain-containing protein
MAAAERWQALPASAGEVRAIVDLLPARAEVHLAADARKRYLLDHRAAGVSLLHLSTHAVVDAENPDRSRILLAADPGGPAFDYLFQEEVYNLDLKGVDLVAVSACDTARGKLVRGEGVAAFSRAFLAAGASATITSLWRVADQPTADFMKQFYYFLAQGKSKADALRLAKLRFLRSGTRLARPRYWAAFILTGDGGDLSARAIPWSWLAGAAAVVLVIVMAQGLVTTGAKGITERAASSPTKPKA